MIVFSKTDSTMKYTDKQYIRTGQFCGLNQQQVEFILILRYVQRDKSKIVIS